MIKAIFVLILSFLFLQYAKAQKQDTLLYFFKNTGEIVAGLSSADYFIMVFPDNEDKNLYMVNEFYANGARKANSKSINSDLPLKFQGPYVEYNKNGHKNIFQTFENGISIGDVIFYYPNGNIYAILNLHPESERRIYLKECRDSTGKVLCENGNGTWVLYNSDYKYYSGGEIKNGLENGEWKGQINDSISYICQYKKGKIISGKGLYKNGKSYSYKFIKVFPKFVYGLGTFSQFIDGYKHYPEYAKKHDIHGDVKVGFTVQSNGNLTDIKILKGSAPSLNEEALRLVNLSPPWQPGRFYGVPVSMDYSVDIYF